MPTNIWYLLILMSCVPLWPGDLEAMGSHDSPNRSVFISPDDPHIRYMGRWNFDDAAAPWVAWQGASIKLRFEGTALQVRFEMGDQADYLRIILNDHGESSRKIALAPGIQTYTVASNLPQGIHTIELVKETNAGSPLTLVGFELTGSRTLPLPAAGSRRIVFYGDSNLAGQSLESEEDDPAWALRGSYFTYAGITARMFDAAYHNISVSGERLSTMLDKYNQMDWRNPGFIWDFSRFEPDVVVVNLGANDLKKTKVQIKADYHRLLDTLRTVHQQAHIVLYNAYGWSHDETANYTHEVIAERNDSAMSVALFPWVFEQFHGCEYDHAGMAALLADHIRQMLGWQPTAADVMNGFGMQGNVANGSFESIAPFGGFGWRYAFRDGVDRIEDASEAYEGDYFARLSSETGIHQPNPATNGDQITVQLMLRGHARGDSARVTIDFRDQQIWSDALSTTSSTFALTTQWQPFSMTVDAPAETSNAIFHTRLTLEPVGKTSIVDIDAVSMATLKTP